MSRDASRIGLARRSAIREGKTGGAVWRSPSSLGVDGGAIPGRREPAHPRQYRRLTLPPDSPELNPVENVSAHLRGNQPSHRVYATYDAIVAACCNAWNALIAAPTCVTSIATRDWARVKPSGCWYPFALFRSALQTRAPQSWRARLWLPCSCQICSRNQHRFVSLCNSSNIKFVSQASL